MRMSLYHLTISKASYRIINTIYSINNSYSGSFHILFWLGSQPACARIIRHLVDRLARYAFTEAALASTMSGSLMALPVLSRLEIPLVRGVLFRIVTTSSASNDLASSLELPVEKNTFCARFIQFARC